MTCATFRCRLGASPEGPRASCFGREGRHRGGGPIATSDAIVITTAIDHPARQPPAAEEPPDFSLVLGGPIYQLLRRAHLSDDALTLVHRRILAGVLVTWLPLLLLCDVGGPGMGGRHQGPLSPRRRNTRAVSRRDAAPHPGRARRPPSHAAGCVAVQRARPDSRPGPAPLQRGNWIGIASAEFVGRRARSRGSRIRVRRPMAGLHRRRREHVGRGTVAGNRRRVRQAVARRLVARGRQPARLPVLARPLVFPRVHLGPLPLARVTHRAEARPDASRPRRRVWDSSPISSSRSLRCSSRTGFCSRA